MKSPPPVWQSHLLSTSPTLVHGFFGRKGGVSQNLYDSLNVSLKGGRDPLENILENRHRCLTTLLPAATPLVMLNQVHGKTVHILTAPPAPGSPVLEGDGLVTNCKGLALGIQTADCLPVLFHDPIAGVIAAAHAGWRGLQAGILEETVLAMAQLGATPRNIKVAIGPAIECKNYEFGEDARDRILASHPNAADFFQKNSPAPKYLFDPKGFARYVLGKAYLHHIEDLDIDTYGNSTDFFSCRRALHQQENSFGCQLSIICLKDTL